MRTLPRNFAQLPLVNETTLSVGFEPGALEQLQEWARGAGASVENVRASAGEKKLFISNDMATPMEVLREWQRSEVVLSNVALIPVRNRLFLEVRGAVDDRVFDPVTIIDGQRRVELRWRQLDGEVPKDDLGWARSAHSNCVLVLPSCMHIAEENHLSDFQAHFLKEHAQCGKREVFIEFFNRAEEDDLVFHDLDHISTFKNSMLDEFCKLFGHLGFSSGALPSSTLLKGIIESLQKGCSPAVSRDRIATTLHHLILATLRHPQLTTRLTLQLRQNVFLRVPINVVGDRDVSIPGGMEGDQGAVCAGSPAPTKPAAAKSSVLAPLHHLLPLLALLTLLHVHLFLLFLCLPNLVCRSWHFSWLRASTVYVCYTHARWYVGSKPPPFRPF
ncbi:hypothetical protein PAPYR_11438 [Paratrimastix pyriformis]|uniref:Uncharacterized protein n=1 Tax=Paratrimastix pyriformis TaxID=342808 RepID=A0ABQ8U5I5_9EUKA|nr:hypothetical protein PAPYR_11438 [Paratrimastix pyriformis]